MTWLERAACAEEDPELFFPPTGGRPEHAKRICRTVHAVALQYEGGFTAHDLEDLRYADLLLAELQSRFETQGDE